MGIPPEGYIQYFTVGREAEVKQLRNKLNRSEAHALLLQANYGSGKTHLLKLIREFALEKSFAVSLVTLDSRSAVRFNRMDQILGAICRNIEVPSKPGVKGIRALFDLASEVIEKHKGSRDTALFWRQVTNDWRWDYSDTLNAPAMFVAIRAWATRKPRTQELIEDWLFQPWQYKGQRKQLYKKMIEDLRIHFRDPRADWQFYADGVFSFDAQGYSQSWSALQDLHSIALGAGLKGLVVLFDEFEDVVTNLNNIQHQEAAFWNLFNFYSGRAFVGKTFYAVTPEFVAKCKQKLMSRNRLDYDYSRFEAIPTFQMSPLDVEQLEELAQKIVAMHSQAFSWDAQAATKSVRFKSLIHSKASVPVQDRARLTITAVVQHLDEVFDESS